MSQDDNTNQSSGTRMLVYGIIAVIVLGVVYYASNRFWASPPPPAEVTAPAAEPAPSTEAPAQPQ